MLHIWQTQAAPWPCPRALLGLEGNGHPAVLQEMHRFLLRVIWCFLVRVQPRVEPEVAALISDSCHSANMKESSKIFMVSKEVTEIQRQHLQCTRVPVAYPVEHEPWCAAKSVPLLTPEGSAHQHTAFSHNSQQLIQPKPSVTESIRMETAFEIISSSCSPSTAKAMSPSATSTVFKSLQGWWFHHCPGQPVPVPDHPFHDGIFSAQTSPVQSEVVSSLPVTHFLGEVNDPHLAELSFQGVLVSKKVPPNFLFWTVSSLSHSSSDVCSSPFPSPVYSRNIQISVWETRPKQLVWTTHCFFSKHLCFLSPFLGDTLLAHIF